MLPRVTCLVLILAGVVASASDAPPPRRDPPPRDSPVVDEFPQDLPIREALLKFWDAQIRFWNSDNRMHYSAHLADLRDADDEKRKLPADLAAADSNAVSPKPYRDYLFKLVAAGDKPSDYIVIAYSTVYEEGKTRAQSHSNTATKRGRSSPIRAETTTIAGFATI